MTPDELIDETLNCVTQRLMEKDEQIAHLTAERDEAREAARLLFGKWDESTEPYALEHYPWIAPAEKENDGE